MPIQLTHPTYPGRRATGTHIDRAGATQHDAEQPDSGPERTLGQEPALLYRVTDAAALLGISRTNMYYLMNDGRVGSVRIGSRRLVPRAALESFVAGLAAAS